MVLERLVFANPGGWWAFGAIAAVTVLYLFYRRYRSLPITGLFLWGAPRRDGGGGSRVEKPLLSRAFWLDIAAAALFALAVLGPGWRSESLLRVMILDTSIAMQARACHEDAARRMAAMWSPGRPTAVLFAGREASAVRDPAPTSRSEIESWLANRYLPAEPDGNLQKAVLLARELYGDRMELHLFTNRDNPGVVYDGTMTVHVLAGRGGNLSLDHVWRRDRGKGEEILATVHNYNDAPVRADITLSIGDDSGGRAYAEQTDLPPGASVRRIALESRRESVYTLSLATAGSVDDVIAVDSRAFLPPQPRGALQYGISELDGAAARYAALAFEAAGCERAADGAMPELLVTSDPEAHGLLATLHVLKPEQPGYLTPPYLVDFTNELCRDADVSQVAWVAAGRDFSAAPDEMYISAGRLPLYWREGNRFILNLSLGHGGLPRDPAWPVLIANLARYCRGLRPGLAQTAYPPGAAIAYRRTSGQYGQKLRLYRGEELVAESAGRQPPVLPYLPGLYRLEAEGEPARSLSVLPLYGPAADTRGLASAMRIDARGGGEISDEGVVDLRWLAVLLGCLTLGCNYAARR